MLLNVLRRQSATANLDVYSEDMTSAARRGRLPMPVNRERELAQILRAFENGARGVILVGSAGVGKKAVIAGLAGTMAARRAPKILHGKRLVMLSQTSQLSKEQWQLILSEAARSGKIVLAIPDIGDIPSGVGDDFVDALGRGACFIVATATPTTYAEIGRTSLGHALDKIIVDEPDAEAAVQIVESKVAEIERETDVAISREAIEQAVALSDRYMHEAYLPKKAIEVCREAAMRASALRGSGSVVTGDDTAAVVAEKTGLKF